MKTIFDCETEIGTLDPEQAAEAALTHPPADGWKIYAHTVAVLTRAKGMLKIEQRCFFRAGNEVSDHPTVKPDMLLEPAPETEEESLSLIRGIHSRFAERLRKEVSDSSPGFSACAAS